MKVTSNIYKWAITAGTVSNRIVTNPRLTLWSGDPERMNFDNLVEWYRDNQLIQHKPIIMDEANASESTKRPVITEEKSGFNFSQTD